jgi:hypothetical protein
MTAQEPAYSAGWRSCEAKETKMSEAHLTVAEVSRSLRKYIVYSSLALWAATRFGVAKQHLTRRSVSFDAG